MSNKSHANFFKRTETSNTERDNEESPSKISSCHLLNLPAEIRNYVYGYILPQGRIVVRDARPPYRPSPSISLPRAITQVCRQLRHETLSMYFYNNMFVMDYGRTPARSFAATTLRDRIKTRFPPGSASFLQQVMLPCDSRIYQEMGGHKLFGPLTIQLFLLLFEVVRLDLPFPLEALLRPIRRMYRMRASLLDELIQETIHRSSLMKCISNITLRYEDTQERWIYHNMWTNEWAMANRGTSPTASLPISLEYI